MELHQEYEAFCHRLRSLPPASLCRWSGTFYREEVYAWATQENIMAGEGARLHGGRWNPPGFCAIYGSLRRATAIMEKEHQFIGAGIPPEDRQVWVSVAAEPRPSFRTCLDLTDGQTRKHLVLGLDRSLDADWKRDNRADREARTQAFGRACIACDIDALLIPSAVDRSHLNMVAFPDVFHRYTRIHVFDGDILPE